MKPVKFSKLVNAVKSLGYTEVSNNGGSHRKYRKNGVSLSIPESREVSPGTLRNLVKLDPAIKNLV